MLQNDRPGRNFRSSRIGVVSKQGGRRKPDRRRRPDQIYRAIVERHFGKTYWTSAFRKCMSSATCWPRETGRNKAGGGPAKTNGASRAPEGQAGARTAPLSAAGGKDMSMTFDIQPASNPTPEKDRVAKLVGPGFGRIFTAHMAVVRYNQAKGGWYEARVE